MIKTIKSFTARDFLAYAAVMALCIGFVYSRSIYSFGLLFMGLYWVSNIKKASDLWKSAWFLCSILLAVIVPISDIVNQNPISNVFYIKLSLPLFFVFFATLKPEGLKLTLINYIVIIVMFFTAFIAMVNYFMNVDQIIEDYKVAKVMKIGTYSDHIRISVAIACSIILAIYEYVNSTSKLAKYLMIFYGVFQFIFLHQLAARTGLIMIYLSLFFLLLNLFFTKNKKALFVLPLLILAPLLSYNIFPSFYQRVGYTLYDNDYYSKMEYREGSSDGLRYYSILAGLSIFEKNKIMGVGFEKLPEESGNWFKSNFPKIKDYEILQPSSQYILYLAAAGVIGFILLMVFFALPYCSKINWLNPYFFAIYSSMLCIMIFEIFLEGQYGIFVFGFFSALASMLTGRKSVLYNTQ
jgi:O-antigen ligase